MEQFLKITIPVSPELHEVLIAELGQINFDSFQEEDHELQAYIQASSYQELSLKDILKRYNISGEPTVEKLQNVNWNEEWEKNFDPVYIEDQVQIRATFHQPLPKFKYDVIINPKMSFGTGHHETTHLIVAEQLLIDHQNKRILDVGTGTGVLAIVAHKLGARSITATDVDDWCIENSRENFGLNNILDFSILQGTIDKLTLPDSYDIIYANINKNVLLAELPYYRKLLSKEGILILSGFYDQDADDILEIAKLQGLTFRSKNTRNNWAMIRLQG